jgi:lysophospholipase L1-like esterase
MTMQQLCNASLTNSSPPTFSPVGPYAVPVSRLITAIVTIAVLLATVAEHRTPVRHNETLDLAVSVNHIAVIGDSYTTGGDEGGLGPKGWTAQAWQWLAQQGVAISADVAAEGGAGYGTRGNHGSVFEDLTADAVRPDDVLVVFFGSRNDQGVDPTQLSILAWGTFQLARRTAPKARFLVIGPPWPTADPPEAVLRIRDTLKYQATVAGATFIDPIADGWFVGRPDLIGKDGVHPTDVGHAYMADKIAPLIGAQLS